MSVSLLLHIFLIIPLAGYLMSLCIPRKNEPALYLVSVGTLAVHFVFFVGVFIYWLQTNGETWNVKDLVLYRTVGYEFFLDFCFDKITAVYLGVGVLLTLLVTIYSRFYLHRESGYKRFFNTLLLFYMGYVLTIFSGNLETLFMGWEILGICSFLLIAFYRDRFLPVKNALKVFTIYRIGDIGLILAMWLCHHLWHQNVTFMQLQNDGLVHAKLETQSLTGLFIGFMILITACAKSAQLPFSSWLPRAMEGPTPSSAIFYGSLSVHIGVFLLLRTFSLWEHQTAMRVAIVVTGLATSVIATWIARVQSSVKSQIAYSSIAQIGLIFIEVGLGFRDLALFHFAGNAFLRTYQLLVSPSVASYLIREQFYNYTPRVHTIEDSWPKKIEYSLYLLSLKEWNLDVNMSRYLWNPLKRAGRKINFFTMKSLVSFFIPSYIIGLICLYSKPSIPAAWHDVLPTVFSLIGLVMVLRAFSERKDIVIAWTLIIMNHFWLVLGISFNENFLHSQVHLYLTGIVASGIVGYLCLYKMRALECNTDLYQFHGHVYEYPKMATAFFLACLGLTGFPITPTFIGEDVIYTHIREDQYVLAISTSLSLIIDGLALVRIFARMFLGPHVKTYHETAYKSS